MLEIGNLTVKYGRVTALRDASMRVDEGEIVGLIGPNGAGKSTAIRAIMGLLRPTTGRIEFDGRQLVGSAPETIVRRGLALVPEGRRIFATLSVEENLLLAGSTVKRADLRGGVTQMYERFPVLERCGSTAAGKLSGGEQQQLAIARALLSRPRLLLLDEPSLGLAPLVVDQLFDLLSGLRDEGVTVFLVEQNARRTLHLADWTYLARNGTIERCVSRSELDTISAEELEREILGFHGAPA